MSISHVWKYLTACEAVSKDWYLSASPTVSETYGQFTLALSVRECTPGKRHVSPPRLFFRMDRLVASHRLMLTLVQIMFSRQTQKTIITYASYSILHTLVLKLSITCIGQVLRVFFSLFSMSKTAFMTCWAHDVHESELTVSIVLFSPC